MTAAITSPIRPADQARGLHWLARCRESLHQHRGIDRHDQTMSALGRAATKAVSR